MKRFSLIIISALMMFILSACDYQLTPRPETEPTDIPSLPSTPDETPMTNPGNIEPFERLFDDSKIKSLTIVITEQAFEDLNDEMYQYHEQFGNFRTDLYARADLLYEDDEGTLLIEDIGFRTRGNTSRVPLMNGNGDLNLSHFKISFKEDFDIEALEPLKDRTVFELEEIDMKFNRNGDSTYLTEKFSLDLMRDFGVHAAHTTLAKVYVKIGSANYFYGIYTLLEPIDKNFIQRRYDKSEDRDEGDLYKVLWQQFGPAALENNYDSRAIGIKDESINYRPAYDLKTNKKSSDHSDLKTFIHNINTLSDSAFRTYIADRFDVDRFLKYLAVNVVLGNPDDYRAMGNNYYFYHEPISNMWTLIPYDYDHGMAQGWDGSPIFSNWTVGADIETWGNLNTYLTGREVSHPLSDRILNIPEYMTMYKAYLDTLVEGNSWFHEDRFVSLYESQKTLYEDSLMMTMYDSIPFGLRNVISYIQNKRADVRDQLNN